MINEALARKLPTRCTVFPSARLADYTTFQLGGLCPALINCPDADALTGAATLLRDASIDFVVIGQGSNLLVADAGIDAVVLRFCAEDAPLIELSAGRVRVSGNTLVDDLARLTIDQGVGDVSFCSGIPGTVGGAIAGNAGAFGRQIGDVVESVDLLDAAGRREVAAAELGFAYRFSKLKETGGIVLNATLKLGACERAVMRQERDRILELRRTKHPDWKTMPCAGSVFRNVEPSSAAERRRAAGWFLEEAGAKDLWVGGAHLFEKHANIIVAEPDASASDVYRLTEKMIVAVESRFGFRLEREIKLLGVFDGKDPHRSEFMPAGRKGPV